MKRLKNLVVKTLQAIEDANVVLAVIDARETISDQDLNLIGFALNAGRSIVIAVNKWDGLQQDHKDEIKRELDRRLGLSTSPVCTLSQRYMVRALVTYLSPLKKLIRVRRNVSTSKLTKIMEMAQEEHQPLVGGRRVKLKYMLGVTTHRVS